MTRKRRWWYLAALPAVFALGIAAFVFVRTQRTLNRAGETVAGEGRFPVEIRALGRMENAGFEAIASPAAYNSGAFYRGKLYVGGGAGLSVYGAGHEAGNDSGDALLKSYRVGVDLPAAPLGQMVVARLRGAAEEELLIATAGAGVLAFTANGGADSGGSFRQLLPKDAEARDVTALLALPGGDLLIGTRRRGLLVFRGGKADALETFHTKLAGVAVTALAGDDTGFWVGTRDRGVMHCHGGEIDSFTAASGGGSAGALPDEQVNAIAVRGRRVFVGTPLGVEEFVDGRPARVLAANVFVRALDADEHALTIGSMDQGVMRVALDGGVRRPGLAPVSLSFSRDATRDTVGAQAQDAATQFLRTPGDSGELYAVITDGPRRLRADGQWMPVVAGVREDAAELSDGNVSALSFGPDGRLWVGYFDHGLDVLSGDGRAFTHREHHEDDHLFCVNRIALDPRRKTMAVATANGLVLFDAQGKPRQVMTKRDGLIADHVTDVAFSNDGMVLATPAGLTFVDAGGTQSLYGFQGLVNNHVYALGVAGQGIAGDSAELLAGTLGGISVLSHEAVKRNLTATNSGLKHNWVTAIVPVSSDGRWMVGTYGAGVMQLRDGLFTPMDGATANMVVNPNAMLATTAHVFAGTLGKGLWVWSRDTGQWRQVTAGLPSENVTAIAARDGEVYVGTENGLVRIAERSLD
jgi:ligand-binding sensor domain-containing protein